MAAQVRAQPAVRRRTQKQAMVETSSEITQISHGAHTSWIDAHKVMTTKINRADHGSLMFSPLAMAQCFAAFRSGAEGQTSAQLCRAAKYGPPALSREAAEKGHAEIIKGVLEDVPFVLAPDTAGHKPTLYFLSTMFIPPRFAPVHQDYIDCVKRSYNFDVRLEADLTNRDYVKAFNDDIAARTNQMVKEAVIPGEFTSIGTMGVVTSHVVYFKGLWEGHNAFDPAETKTMTFASVGGGNIAVPMMKKKKMYGSYTNFWRYDLAVTALYFEGGRFALMLFLPRNTGGRNGITDTENRLHDLGMAEVGAAFMRYHRRARRGDGGLMLNVTLPRINCRMATSMKDAMKRGGATDAFEATAGFPGIRPNTNDANAFIQDCVQTVIVDIDETSAPRTHMPIHPRPRTAGDCRVKTKRLVFNRPFLFMIYDYMNNVSIASGSVYSPVPREAARAGR